MPRGFLVKRSKHLTAFSYRERRGSDDERGSDSGSEHDTPYTYSGFGSPDSGYSASPIALISKERICRWDRENSQNLTNTWAPSASFPLALTVPPQSASSSSSSASSPAAKSAPCTPSKAVIGGVPSHSTGAGASALTNQPSPLSFTAFDTLSLCVNKARGASPATPERGNSMSPGPNSPNRKRGGSSQDRAGSQTGSSKKAQPTPKKPKAARKITFDVDTTSPVSGTIIKELSDNEEDTGKVVYGDIEPSYNLVEITPEARAELEKIENKLGDYICQLCKEMYEDAFQLAQHRCSRIVHVEYRCPECDKVFNCPANLASHRRWHKPRPTPGSNPSSKTLSASNSGGRSLLPAPQSNLLRQPADSVKNGVATPVILSTGVVPTATTDPEKLLLMRLVDGKHVSGKNQDWRVENCSASPQKNRGDVGEDNYFSCETCGKKFRRQAYLRKHVLSHVTGGGGTGVSACHLCGKMLLNENERARHEAEHHSHLINNNTQNINVNDRNSNSPPVTIAATTTTPDNANINNNNFAVPQKGPILMTPSIPGKDLTCSICRTTCPNKVALDKHLRTHSRDVFPCKYCDNTFYSSPGLTRHINKCHPTENRQVILLQLPVSRPC
nr:hypothetical protein BaRGS_023928 [Batillaria attramentaria]